MDNRIRVFGGLALVAVLFVSSLGLLIWRDAQADPVNADSPSDVDGDGTGSDSTGSDSTGSDSTGSDGTGSDGTATDDDADGDGTTSGGGEQGPLEEFVDEAVAFIENLRGAPFKEQPVVLALPEEAFVARVEGDLEADFAQEPELVVRNTTVQRAMGFIEPDQTSDEVLRQFLAAGVLGFYDPETKELVVRQTAELDLLTKSTIVHELTHAYDDQHYDLDRPELKDDDFTERSWTFTAVAEGSASHVETRWVETLTAGQQADLAQQEANFGDPSVFLAFDFAYLLLQISVYVEGEPYVDAIVEIGGYDLLEATFMDLPLTSEEVMEFGSVVDDFSVDVPVPSVEGDVAWEGVGGQVVLDSLFAGTFSGNEEAATGWGGDAMVFYRDDAESCVRWDIVMDTEADEQELVDALRQWSALRGGTVSIVDDRVRLDRCA